MGSGRNGPRPRQRGPISRKQPSAARHKAMTDNNHVGSHEIEVEISEESQIFGTGAIAPVTTKLPIRHNVPCLAYSNSISWHFPAIIALSGAIRSSACKPVISSTLTVWVWWLLSSSGAERYVS